ncbi:MAG TPA: VWA domain-containing protein [Kofleriaceae bacterium]|nr:VWA domain-containing protein [Kofleriaceae bacterium]
MRSISRGLLLRIAVGVVAAGLTAVALHLWLAPEEGGIALDWGDRTIDFLSPTWFYLAALVPYFFVVRTQSLTDVSLAQQYLATGVRSLLVVGLAAALARPVWTTTDDKVATVVLVDVSESITDQQLAAARAYVDQLDGARREQDRLYVVSFAERPHVVKRDQDEAIARHPGEGAGTNIQSAVQLGYGLYPDGYLPRMVIVSDGNQTGGDLLVEAYRANQLGVRVSWKAFAAERRPEVRVLSLGLPDEIKVGQPFEVAAELWSTHAQKVTLALQQDDFPNAREPRKTVQLEAGRRTKVAFASEAKRAGHTTYRLRVVESEKDTEQANNTAVMAAPVKGRPRVLYVEGGVLRSAGVAANLQRALEHENIDVEVRGPRGLPATAAELEKFDLVLVSDVPAHFMGLGQMAALESYVRDLGGGLIMAGGEDSFGSGGYQGTRIEKIMPVRFDSEKEREQPHVALVLVVDRSGSMSGPKLDAAKESARATVEVLSPSDLIGVIVFDNTPTTLVRLQRASNRLRISTDISRLVAGGGTHIFPALQEAFQTLQAANAKVKHVILLSDGQAPYDGIAELCQEMRASRITVSAVGIGDADRNLLQQITDNGEGRLYMTEDLSALPRIFMKETTEAQKAALVEDRIRAVVNKNVEMIEGTGVATAPPLHGYVATKPKPTAEVVLIADRTGDPILARWRLGTGTSVAWTSDVKSRWSTEWIQWAGYPKFWAQVVRTSMRRKVYDSYDLVAQVHDGRAQVVVDAVDVNDRFVNELDTTLEIVDPASSKTLRSVPMVQTAAGRYTADFAVDRYGSYLLKAVHKRGGRVVAESVGSAALPYPLEYFYTDPDEAPLRHAAQVTGGRDQATPAAIYDPAGQSIAYTQDLWPWVVLFVACLFILDTYLKRVRVFGYRTIEF